jgi:hypothetical protein
MISQGTIQALEQRGLEYILGARMRRQREVREAVLGRAGRYQEVAENLRVKEVWVEGHRYVVCHNPEEAAKDAGDREVILQALEDQLQQGALHLIGNRGFRHYEKGAHTIDARKVAAEARYDGKFVLRTNTPLPAAEIALQYPPEADWWSGSSGGSNRSWRPGPSSTSGTPPSGDTCSAPFWPWYWWTNYSGGWWPEGGN